MLLLAYLLARATLGAMVNPAYNGPDESAHVEYVRTLAEHGWTGVTGVEARQPPAYYSLAALPWRASEGLPDATRLFFVRLLSGVAGAAVLACAWLAGRAVWPERPALAAVAAIVTLAPGHLFLLASVNNDPLAAAFAAIAALAAIRLWPADAAVRRWALVFALAATAAVATKLTASPVVLSATAALAWRHGRVPLRRWPVRIALGSAAIAAIAAYAVLLAHHPTTSLAAALAHFWWRGMLRAPVAYVAGGGLAESFRTWWYGYDYMVRWPVSLELVLGGSALLVSALAVAGTALGAIRRRTVLPGVIWAMAAAQAVFVAGRFGFGDLLQIEMGGAAQAKAFFPALVPLAILFTGGLGHVAWRAGASGRALALGVFAWLLVLDATSLAATLWHHYRWWQVGV